jgi:hypothetical protein
MEYEFTEDYEEDFEVSHEDKKKQINELDVKTEENHMKNTKKVSDKYNPDDVLKTYITTNKKSLQTLEKENYQLRCDLKSLNMELTELLESKETQGKKRKNKSKEQKINSKDQKEKKLIVYELEYNKIKETYDKFNDTSLFINLNNEINEKQSKILELEKSNKRLQFDIESKQKDLQDHVEKDIPEDRNIYKLLIDENMQIIKVIDQIQQKNEKEKIKHEKNIQKEAELKEKLEKLKIIADEYLNTRSHSNKQKELYENNKKNLKNVEIKSSASLVQLKIQEKDMRIKKEEIEKEIKAYQDLIKKKTEALNEVQAELGGVMHMAPSSSLTKLSVLLKSLQRSYSVKKSASPKIDTEKNTVFYSKNSPKNLKPLIRNSSSGKVMKIDKGTEFPEQIINKKEFYAEKKNKINLIPYRPSFTLETHVYKKPEDTKALNEDLPSPNVQIIENKVPHPVIDPPKSSILAELEQNDKPLDKVYVKPSIFEELDPKNNEKESEINENQFKPIIIPETFVQTDIKITADRNQGESFVKSPTGLEKIENFEEKLFSKIQLSDPSQKRDRKHLFTEENKKQEIDLISSERMINQDFVIKSTYNQTDLLSDLKSPERPKVSDGLIEEELIF